MDGSMIAGMMRAHQVLDETVERRLRITERFLEAAGVKPEDVSEETLEEAYLLADRMVFEAAQARAAS